MSRKLWQILTSAAVMIDVLRANYFPSCVNFSSLLMTFANSSDPDQEQQTLNPDLDPNCLTLICLLVFLIYVFEKVNLEKNQLTTKTKACKITYKNVNMIYYIVSCLRVM